MRNSPSRLPPRSRAHFLLVTSRRIATPECFVQRLNACGWRRAEIRLLRWENVDRKAREVRLDDSKNGDGRVLPLVDETWAMFERLWAERQYSTPNGTALSGYVFHKRGRPVGDSNFTKRWQTAHNRAGLPGKLFHDSRRTAARNMIRAGVPQTVAMSITGHRTDSMFRRYDITTTTDKREALQKQRDFLKDQLVSSAMSNVTEISDRTRTNG